MSKLQQKLVYNIGEKEMFNPSFVFVMVSLLHCGQGAHGELLGNVMRWCRAARI